MISEFNIDNKKYLLNNGLFGVCDGALHNHAHMVYIDLSNYGNISESPDDFSNLLFNSTPIIRIYFPNGLVNQTNNYFKVVFQTSTTTFIYPEGDSDYLTSDIYNLPKDTYCLARITQSGLLLITDSAARGINLGHDSILETPKTRDTKIVLNGYYPPFLISHHTVFTGHPAGIPGYGRLTNSPFTTTCNLTDTYSLSSNNVKYYALSVIKFSSSVRRWVACDLYLTENNDANTCKVVSDIIDNTGNTSTASTASFGSVSVLWGRG